MTPEVTAVILCGGTSRRMAVADKTALPIEGRSVLDHVLAGLPGDWPRVCVGVDRPLDDHAPGRAAPMWVREDPPLGGPVAGIDAALTVVTSPYVVLLAGDQPLGGAVAEQLVRCLRQEPDTVDAVWSVADNTDAAGSPPGDAAGEGPHLAQRAQPMPAAYRTGALRAVVRGRRDVGLYATLRALRTVNTPVAADALLDLDEPDDLDRIRTAIRRRRDT